MAATHALYRCIYTRPFHIQCRQAILRELVETHPDATLIDLSRLLKKAAHVSVSETTMWRCLQRMGITLKKKILYAVERNRPDVIEARRRFELQRGCWAAERLVFVDESGVNLAMTRAVARALRGERVVDHGSSPSTRANTVGVPR
jgi:hypothetical protein